MTSDSDFKSKALVQQAFVVKSPHQQGLSWVCWWSMHCGRRWRQSSLGSSSWGQRSVGEAAHCSKIEPIVLRSWSSLSCTDSAAGQIPCWALSSISGSSYIATEIKQCLEKVRNPRAQVRWAVGAHIQDREPGKGGRLLHVAANN